MQIPPASFSSLASGIVGTTANSQKTAAASAPAEATAVTNTDVAELSQGNADRDAQGQADGLPGKRGSATKNSEQKQPEPPLSSPEGVENNSGGLDLWG